MVLRLRFVVSEFSRVTVAVRKRPIFDEELAKGEYDVATVLHPRVVVHDCRMAPDLKQMHCNHISFPFDFTFSEECSNEIVYKCIAKPLVAWSMGGGLSTVFMYGQTGSGKTHTMSAIQQRAAADVFRALEIAAKSGHHLRVGVTFFEIAGKQLFDLLNDRASLSLMEGADGRVHVKGTEEVPVRSADALLGLVRAGNAQRSSRATGKNDNSSRSHSVLKIVLRDARSSEREGPGARGSITLVDLAGSERGEDSKGHDASRMKEAAEINSSLMCLKDCIRLRATAELSGKEIRVPYRSSKLTQVLKDSFVDRNSRTGVIATISPIPSDTEHTVNTLRHASLMKSGASDITETTVTVKNEAQWQAEQAPLPTKPAMWSHEEVIAWMSEADKGIYAPFVSNVQRSITGKNFVRLPKARFVMICNGDELLGEALFQAVRDEIAHVNEEHAARRNQQRSLRDKRRSVTAAAAEGSSAAPARRASRGRGGAGGPDAADGGGGRGGPARREAGGARAAALARAAHERRRAAESASSAPRRQSLSRQSSGTAGSRGSRDRGSRAGTGRSAGSAARSGAAVARPRTSSAAEGPTPEARPPSGAPPPRRRPTLTHETESPTGEDPYAEVVAEERAARERRPSTSDGRLGSAGGIGDVAAALGGSPDSIGGDDRRSAAPTGHKWAKERERAKERELADQLLRDRESDAREWERRRMQSPPTRSHSHHGSASQLPAHLPHIDARAANGHNVAPSVPRTKSMPPGTSAERRGSADSITSADRQRELSELGAQLIREPESPGSARVSRKDGVAPPPTPDRVQGGPLTYQEPVSSPTHGADAEEMRRRSAEGRRTAEDLRVRLRAAESAKRRAQEEANFAKEQLEQLTSALEDTQAVMERMKEDRDEARREVDELRAERDAMLARQGGPAARSPAQDGSPGRRAMASTASTDASALGGSQGMEFVNEWLKKLRLGSYADKLVDIGVDSLAALAEVGEDDLDAIGMKKLHKKRYLRAVEEAMETSFDTTAMG